MGVCCGRIRKAYNGDAAAGADISILIAVCRFVNNINKGFGSGFHIGQRGTGHASGAVQHKDNVCRI